jgi:hypothetical protein
VTFQAQRRRHLAARVDGIEGHVEAARPVQGVEDVELLCAAWSVGRIQIVSVADEDDGVPRLTRPAQGG